MPEMHFDSLLQSMKNDLDSFESRLNSLYRLTSDLSQRTQETDFSEPLQEQQAFIQRLKLAVKDLMRKATDGQAKYSLYSQHISTYQQLLDAFETSLDHVLAETELWSESSQFISIGNIHAMANALQTLIHEQSSIQRQAQLVYETIESLVDSTDDVSGFR